MVNLRFDSRAPPLLLLLLYKIQLNLSVIFPNRNSEGPCRGTRAGSVKHSLPNVVQLHALQTHFLPRGALLAELDEHLGVLLGCHRLTECEKFVKVDLPVALFPRFVLVDSFKGGVPVQVILPVFSLAQERCEDV